MFSQKRYLDYVYLPANIANLLCFTAGTVLTWSAPVSDDPVDITVGPFGREITLEESSWISSLPLFGAALCPFLFGYMADRIGRKPTLLYLAIPYFAGYMMMSFGANVKMFCLGRFITGIGVGGVFTVLAMYIGEISTKNNRGILTTSMTSFFCLGMFFSVCIGPFVSSMIYNLVLAAPSLIFLVAFYYFGTESPYHLVSIKQNDLAKQVLKKLGRTPEELEEEFQEIQTSVQDLKEDFNVLDIFRSKPLIKGLVISTSLLVFQQLSGINAVIFYSPDIFKESGTILKPEYCTIIVMAIQFLSSFVTPFIADRFGRKTILLYSIIGIVISEVPLGVYCCLESQGINVKSFSSIPVITLTAYLIFLNIGLGPLPWTILAELFPPKFKSFSTAAVSTFIWAIAFVFTLYFEKAIEVFGLGPLFLFFSTCAIIGVIFTIFCVIETKGKTLQEIQDLLHK
nr:facilitated trehalose transporter Tret1-2 homolog [Leptinotarsa decemlineata]